MVAEAVAEFKRCEPSGAGYGELTTEIARDASSNTPRTTTSSTSRSTRTGTAGWAAGASRARSAWASRRSGAAAFGRAIRRRAGIRGPQAADSYAGVRRTARGRVRHPSAATTSAIAAITLPNSSNVGSSPSGVTTIPAAIAGSDSAAYATT